MTEKALLPNAMIDSRIFIIREHRVMLDRDLALLYRIKPIALRQQVKRNITRFPNDFMFQLTEQETGDLLSQNVIPTKRHLGGSLPFVFTEQGVAMLSSVLRSRRAILVNIAIMRAFVRLRRIIATRTDLAHTLVELERKYETHDRHIRTIFEALHRIMSPPVEPRKRIGF